MTLCAVCKDYPAGTTCSMTGCPGRTYKLERVPYRPTSFADWRKAVHGRINGPSFAEQNESVLFHNGGVSK